MSTLKVDNIRHNSATSDAITTHSDGSCTANITNNLSNRNVVINGAMLINQRASSYTATGEEYTLDRFHHRTGSGFTFDTTTTQDSSAPDGFSKSLKITPDSTQTPTGSHNGMIGHLIEADNLIGFASGTSSAKKFVLSFYAKSASQNNNHQYSVQLLKLATSGQYYYVNKAFTVTSSWQRFTVAFAADTSNNITTGNGEGLRILFHLATGPDDIGSEVSTWTAANGNFAVTGQSNFMDNTSNEFYLTGVQLEASDSDVATDFEHPRSIGEELLLCQRYYRVLKDGSEDNGGYIGLMSYNYDVNSVVTQINFIPEMRATPTADSTAGTNYYRFYRNSGYVDINSLSVLNGLGRKGGAFNNADSGNGTAGQAGGIVLNNTSAKIAFSAEL